MDRKLELIAFAFVVALGHGACVCAKPSPPVKAAAMPGAYRLTSKLTEDDLTLVADGGFAHCWTVGQRRQYEKGSWELKDLGNFQLLYLSAFTDTVSGLHFAGPVSTSFGVGRSRGELVLLLSPDEGLIYIPTKQSSCRLR